MLKSGSNNQIEEQAGGEGRAAPVTGHEGFAQTFFLI
jgi:hypothetical protein